MISDVLSDAIGDIEDYQREPPDSYAEFAAEIDVVKTIMNGLLIVLDASSGIPGEHETLLAEMRLAIRGLDVSGIVAARDRLLAWVAEERKRISETKGA